MIKAKLREWHLDELADKAKYEDMANKLDATDPTAAGLLRDMAHEEHTHADMIKYILEH